MRVGNRFNRFPVEQFAQELHNLFGRKRADLPAVAGASPADGISPRVPLVHRAARGHDHGMDCQDQTGWISIHP